ncbi:branched chain amino acid ABC transporter substrate-binding protein [Phytohabitans suffuscus]|uniref:Branched chain amino acid ABC transporter substrate-binding protein n=1 Tax=Phytohabitans suffuscus TaxID=624315 RepID=A0A6F8YRR3_9ACTN|nr:branched chain amino acid ABC transporter substrate-binding protein [Phytohabitans suffuscus]
MSLVALAGCGGGDGSGSDSDTANAAFEIYAVAPLSGAIAASGAQVKAGIEAAVAVINDKGGINGKQVNLTIDDDAGDPTQVAARMQQVLQSDSKPDLIFTGLTSTEAVAALPLTNQAGVLAAGPAASSEMEQFDQYLSATPLAVDASKAALKAVADSGAKTIGVLVVDNVSGASAAGDFNRFAADYGLSITGSEKIAPTATDASAQLERLRSGDPDVLLYSGFSPVVGPVLQGKLKIGWDVPAFADQTVGAFPYTSLVSPAELKGFTVVAPSYVVKGSESANTEAMRTAVAAIEKAYGKDFDAPIQAAIHSYMSIVLVKYAVEAAGTSEAKVAWDARKQLTPQRMPLYVGSSALFQGEALNWAVFPPADWSAVVAANFEHGFIVPMS